MSTQAQVLANRRNARQSTGPKTVEGKEVVSQNAVRHGLCARRDVLRGEDQGEFERHREAMLDDLAPVGAMESMLAQRIVSLSWRLVRAQRMQDAAIEALCADYVRGPLTEDTLARVAKTVGRTKEDRPGPEDELTLGLAVAGDFSQERALERLLAYEGKIEASLYKAMNELEKLRRVRRADGAAGQNKANPQPRDGFVASLLAMTNEGPAQDTAQENSTAQNKANLADESAVQNKANGPVDQGGERGRSPYGQADATVQNKANSACSVPVRACPVRLRSGQGSEHAEGAYPARDEGACLSVASGPGCTGETPGTRTPDGVTAGGENKANVPVDEVSAPNKANSPVEQASGVSEGPSDNPLPFGT